MVDIMKLARNNSAPNLAVVLVRAPFVIKSK